MAASLDSSLMRIRGAAKPGHDVVLVHGPIAVGEAPWMWRYISARVANDPDFALLVSSRLPSLFGVAPGVAFHSLNGPPLAIPVEPPASTDVSLSSSSSPLDLVVTLVGQALRIRCDQKTAASVRGEQSDRTSSAPDHTMALVIDDLPTLLLEHPLSDVIEAITDMNAGVKGARCSPVIVCLDPRVVDDSVFTALAAIASVVIKLEEPPKLAGAGALGYQQGTLTFTEALSSGKTRSFRQDYNVHSNGAFTLGAIATAAPAAALANPQPTSTAAATVTSATSRGAAKTPAPAPAPVPVSSSQSLVSTSTASALAASAPVGTVTLHAHRSSTSDSRSGGTGHAARDPLPHLNDPALAASVGGQASGLSPAALANASLLSSQGSAIKPVIFSAAGANKPGASLRKLADVEGVGGAGGYDDDGEDDEGHDDLDDDLDL